MADETAVSTPETEQASTQTEGPGVGLAAALNKAFDEVGLGEAEAEKEPTEEKKVESPEGEAPKQEGQEPGKPEEAPKVAAPQQWDAATKAKFDRLPDAAKAIVMDLAKHQERDYTRKTQELANERRFAQSVMGLITNEHREQLRQAGLNEVQGFERLLQYQDYALRQPKDYVRWFTQTANLQPADIFPELAGARPPQAQPGQPQGQPQRTNGATDPRIDQLQRYVEHINGWMTESQQREQQQQQERQQQSQRSAQGIIDRFRSAVDDKGVPLRPHFAQVEEKMTKLLLNDPDLNQIEDQMERLQEAYEAAIYTDKTVRQLEIKAAADKQRTADQRQKDVSKARAAVAPISSPAQVSEGKPAKAVLGDQVAQSMKELGVL